MFLTTFEQSRALDSSTGPRPWMDTAGLSRAVAMSIPVRLDSSHTTGGRVGLYGDISHSVSNQQTTLILDLGAVTVKTRQARASRETTI